MDKTLEEEVKHHIYEDYPNVIVRLTAIEKLLEQINGGIKVLKFFGWALTTMSGLWLFFQEFIVHITTKGH